MGDAVRVSTRTPVAPARAGRAGRSPDVRRADLVRAAWGVFAERGYEKATIAEVIERAGVSKGGFYHHFKSKEDLLEAVTMAVSEDALRGLTTLFDDPSLGALERLQLFLSGGHRWKREHAAELAPVFIDALVLGGDHRLRQRMTEAAVMRLAPVLRRLVDEGMASGQFDVTAPGLTVEILLRGSELRFKVTAQAIRDIRAGRTEAGLAAMAVHIAEEEALFERLLGLPRGTIKLGGLDGLEVFARAVL